MSKKYKQPIPAAPRRGAGFAGAPGSMLRGSNIYSHDNAGAGIDPGPGGRAVFIDCKAEHNGGAGFYSGPGTNASFVGCTSSNNEGGGFVAEGANVDYSGCVAEGNGRRAIPEDLLVAIRKSMAMGEAPEKIERTFGMRLKGYGVDLAKAIAVSANSVKLYEWLSTLR